MGKARVVLYPWHLLRDVLMDIGDFDNSSSNSDEKLFQRTKKVHQMVFITTVVGLNTFDLFNSKELDLGAS
jgi:hypothetical protein